MEALKTREITINENFSQETGIAPKLVLPALNVVEGTSLFKASDLVLSASRISTHPASQIAQLTS